MTETAALIAGTITADTTTADDYMMAESGIRSNIHCSSITCQLRQVDCGIVVWATIGVAKLAVVASVATAFFLAS